MFCFRKGVFLLFLLCFARSAHAINDVYVVHFVLDGLRYDVLNRFVQEGALPNLKKYFMDHGARFEEALTLFPSVSSPSYISFATGLEAGNSGIFALEWFDRTKAEVKGYLTLDGVKKVNGDLLNRIALMDENEPKLHPPTTLFEKLSPEPTAAIYTPFRKGASIAKPKSIPLSAIADALLSLDGLELDRLAMHELSEVFSRHLQKLPRYTMVALYAADYYEHKTGIASAEVLATLKQFDFYFKKFLDQLKEKGIADKTYIILSSDHGMHPTGGVFELRDVLWKKGIRDKSVYVSNRGVSSTFLYAKGEKGWGDLPSLERLRHFPAAQGPLDLIQTVLACEETDWVAVRDGFDAVRIFKQDGEGLIKTIPSGHRFFYSYSYSGKDPLGYEEDPKLRSFLKGIPFSTEEWVAATTSAAAPNGVVALANLFQEPRVGDMVIVAKRPWGFRKEKAGTHGSLTQEDMHIPLWIAGPHIAPGSYSKARGVDLFPTVLNWFGFDAKEYQDQEGRPLFQKKDEKKDDVGFWLAELENAFPSKKSYPANLRSALLERCHLEKKTREAELEKLERLCKKTKRHALRWSLGVTAKAQVERIRRLDAVEHFLQYH